MIWLLLYFFCGLVVAVGVRIALAIDPSPWHEDEWGEDYGLPLLALLLWPVVVAVGALIGVGWLIAHLIARMANAVIVRASRKTPDSPDLDKCNLH